MSVPLSLPDSSSQAPIPANIISTDRNQKDWAVPAIECSATESTSGLIVVRNGFSALAYRKDGSGMICSAAFA